MWYDNLIVIGMFMLRILVPVALTVAVGYWLEKRLGLEVPESIELAEPVARAAARGEGAVQIGPAVPCWEVKGCDLSSRADCPAYERPEIPCWLANELALGKLQAECTSCDLYRLQAELKGRPQLRVVKGKGEDSSQVARTG